MAAFMEHGYAGTSTLEIATRAKVSKRELYAHFGDKQAMLAAGILERAKRMRDPLALPPARSLDGLVAALCAFGEAVLREATHPAVTAVFRLAITEADRSPEIARELLVAGRNANREVLTNLLSTAETSGLLRGDPRSMATEFVSLLWDDLQLQLLLRTVTPPGPAEIARRARNATGSLLSLHATGRESRGRHST
jgi:AcrR family transcriptional regulator